jgi:two-component system NtrC family sensor kinase
MIKINLNLRVKLMLIFLLLVLVPLITIGWFSLKTTEDLIVNMVVRQLQNVAVDKIALLEHWLDERKADLKVIAETSLLKSMDPDLILPYLDLIRNKYGVYKDLTVISASGHVISRSREDPGSVEQTDNASLLAIKKSLFMSEITYIPEERESSFLIAAPIFSDNGKLMGTIYGKVGTNKIVSFILNVSLGETGECYLVDKEGRFLAHKDPSRILKENISQTGSFKNIFQERDSKKTYFDYRGIQVMGTSLKIRGKDWYVVVEQDREEAFLSVKNLKYIIYLTTLLGIGSALMLTWMISYHMIKPIRVLSKYAGFIADSDFDKAVIKYRRSDEIGMLFRAFENMSLKLKERQNNLEQKVELKKAKLKETDKILRKTKLIAERSEKFAAIGRMGAAIAHEIRTPIASLKLFVESAQDKFENTAEDEEDFQIAMKQITRIEATINRFLDLTKPQDLVLSEIDIRKLMEDVILIIKPLATRQECSLDIHIDKTLPEITGDRKMLTEALINLFVNALEASPAQGKITVTLTTDHFDLDKTAKTCIRIDISDTGHGISEEPIENIFEPFFTTKSSGTGLGLPLVLNTIKSHGGVIRVKSKVEQGTTFSLFLPLEFKKL